VYHLCPPISNEGEWRELRVKEVVNAPGTAAFDGSLLLEEDVLNYDRLLLNHNMFLLHKKKRVFRRIYI
jgi:hypothetical protein